MMPPAAAYTPAQLTLRDTRTAIVTLFTAMIWGYVAHVSADTPEPTRIVMTADAIRVAQYVCRKNDGVKNIEPLPEPHTVVFHCRDGARFTETVRLR